MSTMFNLGLPKVVPILVMVAIMVGVMALEVNFGIRLARRKP